MTVPIRSMMVAAGLALMVASCTSADPNIEPVPGSITYGGHQPRTKLTKSPIGSTFTTQITDEYGRQAIETYQIQPDRSLKLIRRQQIEVDVFGFGR